MLERDRQADRSVARVCGELRLGLRTFQEYFGQSAVWIATDAGGVGEAPKLEFSDFVHAAIGKAAADHRRTSPKADVRTP
jgi:hypothetical protein